MPNRKTDNDEIRIGNTVRKEDEKLGKIRECGREIKRMRKECVNARKHEGVVVEGRLRPPDYTSVMSEDEPGRINEVGRGLVGMHGIPYLVCVIIRDAPFTDQELFKLCGDINSDVFICLTDYERAFNKTKNVCTYVQEQNNNKNIKGLVCVLHRFFFLV